MTRIPVFQYTIPLEQTKNGREPAYDYPEGNEINKYEKGESLIVIQDKVIPHFHRDSIAVKVEILVEEVIEENV